MTPTAAAETGGSRPPLAPDPSAGPRPPLAPNGSGGSHPPPAEPAEAPLARALRILSGDIRPDDYLAVPPEVQADHDREMNRLLVEEGIDVAPATRRDILAYNTLRHYFAGQEILRRVTEHGVLVLAADSDEVSAFHRAVPPEQWKFVTLDYPY